MYMYFWYLLLLASNFLCSTFCNFPFSLPSFSSLSLSNYNVFLMSRYASFYQRFFLQALIAEFRVTGLEETTHKTVSNEWLLGDGVSSPLALWYTLDGHVYNMLNLCHLLFVCRLLTEWTVYLFLKVYNCVLVWHSLVIKYKYIEHCMAAATTVQTNGNNNGDSRIENTSILVLLACSYSTILCLALTPNKLLLFRSWANPCRWNTISNYSSGIMWSDITWV